MSAWSLLQTEMRSCRRCLEAGHDITPGAVFRGSQDADVLLIGQAPGVTEVEAKRPFNAGSGRRLFQWLGEAGWDEDQFRDTQYMTAVTKCYPGRHATGKGDRVPSREEQALCRPFLEREIQLVNPRLMILVGGLAIKLLFPKSATLRKVIGTAVYFPPAALSNPVNFRLKDGQWLRDPDLGWLNSLDEMAERNGRFVIPLPHPSGASLWPNNPHNKQLIAKAIKILHHIRQFYQSEQMT